MNKLQGMHLYHVGITEVDGICGYVFHSFILSPASIVSSSSLSNSLKRSLISLDASWEGVSVYGVAAEDTHMYQLWQLLVLELAIAEQLRAFYAAVLPKQESVRDQPRNSAFEGAGVEEECFLDLKGG